MMKNMVPMDRGIRVVIALILVGLGFYMGIWWLYFLALVPVLTAAVGYCPLYTLLGIGKKDSEKR